MGIQKRARRFPIFPERGSRNGLRLPALGASGTSGADPETA